LRDGRTVSRLIKLVRMDRDPQIREAAAYALGIGNMDRRRLWRKDGGMRLTRETRVLREVLADRSESGIVRGMAAEHLVFVKAAIPDLIRGLRDEAREVRFWCAYALGAGWVKRALPELRRLTTDRSRVKGWWSIAREARWAIASIEGGPIGSPEP
jgi:HEAT repeat protein